MRNVTPVYITTKFRDTFGQLTPYAFACGYVERFGDFVTLSHENDCYHIRRHPSHVAGHRVMTERKLADARRLAQGMADAY